MKKKKKKYSCNHDRTYLKVVKNRSLDNRLEKFNVLGIDLFTDTVAILISIVSKDIMACPGGKC